MQNININIKLNNDLNLAVGNTFFIIGVCITHRFKIGAKDASTNKTHQ